MSTPRVGVMVKIEVGVRVRVRPRLGLGLRWTGVRISVRCVSESHSSI